MISGKKCLVMSFSCEALNSSYHINQLGYLESEAYFDGVVGVLDRPDPALVSLEKVPEESILHLCQRHKLALG